MFAAYEFESVVRKNFEKRFLELIKEFRVGGNGGFPQFAQIVGTVRDFLDKVQWHLVLWRRIFFFHQGNDFIEKLFQFGIGNAWQKLNKPLGLLGRLGGNLYFAVIPFFSGN